MAKYPQSIKSHLIVGHQLGFSAVGAEICIFPIKDTESGPKEASLGWSFKRPCPRYLVVLSHSGCLSLGS